jgi:hypothetical protein
VASAGYRWYLGAQVISLAGTMMGYTGLFWLVLHIAHGGAPALAAAAMALLVGGFGYQFAVTNPLMASRVFHLGAAGFGLFGTCTAVGGIAGTYYSSRRQDPARASS